MANFLLRCTASIRILLFCWGSLIEPGGLSVYIVGTSFFHYCCQQIKRRDVYGIPHNGHEEIEQHWHALHNNWLNFIQSLATWELKFAIKLRPQATSKEVLRLQKAFTFPLFALHNIQEQCVQVKYMLGLGGKPSYSNSQMNILPIAFSLYIWDGH